MIRRERPQDSRAPITPAFAKEFELQRLIADSPSLLPGVDDPPTAVATELRVPGAGRADVVVVDAEGTITIVECKRAANPEMRRWVIGQVFSYGAGLWKLDYEDLARGFAACGTSLTRPFTGSVDWDEEEFRSAVAQNLRDGAFRLVIAVDEISPALQRAVVFINSHTRPDVRLLALELRHVKQEQTTRLASMVYGDNDDIEPLRPPWPPDRWTLTEGIRKADPVRAENAVRAAEGLLDWAEGKRPLVAVSYTDRQAGIEVATGARLFRLGHREVRVSRSGLAAYAEKGDAEKLVADLNDIGLKLERDRPRAALDLLADDDTRANFIALMERYLATVSA